MKKSMYIFLLFFALPLCGMEEKKRKQKSVLNKSPLGQKIHEQLKAKGIVEKKPRRANAFFEALIQYDEELVLDNETLRFPDYKNPERFHTCSLKQARGMLNRAKKQIRCYEHFGRSTGEDTSEGMQWFIKTLTPAIHDVCVHHETLPCISLLPRNDMYIIQLSRLSTFMENANVNRTTIKAYVTLNYETLLERISSPKGTIASENNIVEKIAQDQENTLLLLRGIEEQNIEQIKEALRHNYFAAIAPLMQALCSIVQETPEYTIERNEKGEKTYIPCLELPQ